MLKTRFLSLLVDPIGDQRTDLCSRLDGSSVLTLHMAEPSRVSCRCQS